MILVETPLNDARTQAVFEQVKKLVPGKLIRYVVNSHSHFDHSGGLRTAVAEGATIITQANNVPTSSACSPAEQRPPDHGGVRRKAASRACRSKLDLGDARVPSRSTASAAVRTATAS